MTTIDGQDLEHYFSAFRKHVIGHELEFDFRAGRKKVLYADWAASGRLYQPIETYLTETLGPYVANTHTETNLTGRMMTSAYHQAKEIIKQHVGASDDDMILFSGFGMTAAVNKFQRILGVHVCEQWKGLIEQNLKDRPLVIITHMEHHSNQTSWEECVVDVAIIRRAEDGMPDLNDLERILIENQDRKIKIGSFSACSNVTGILTPYYEMAELMHRYGGICCVDFSASAPYVSIQMNPGPEERKLDAIFFSPHKFLGGPGSSGIMVFHKTLYRNRIPDQPGGGTVMWTNPWGEHQYYEDIEVREDGGTPGFLQAIRAALAIRLKEAMGIEHILAREEALKEILLTGMAKNPFITILEPEQSHRLGFISFYSRDLHYNLIVKLLNDYFGIQTRGGCSCAGTYGHILLGVDRARSASITQKIGGGDLSEKPGWVRISLHPTMTRQEVETIVHALDQVILNYHTWAEDYHFNCRTGEFEAKDGPPARYIDLKQTFGPTG